MKTKIQKTGNSQTIYLPIKRFGNLIGEKVEIKGSLKVIKSGKIFIID